MSREIHVFGDWQELGEVQRMGLLRANQVRGAETFSFEYDPDWLASDHAMSLDPNLLLYEGPQYLNDNNRPNFGLFLDSSPDRWGRLLMERREAVAARQHDTEPRRLLESDFLLGVHDQQRMGGLRFKESIDAEFLSNKDGMNAPPWARLRELENAAWQIQSDDSDNDPNLREWLNLLMAPGSSIGGARPKAGVCDEQDQLWIAKFPSRGDDIDIGAWEMLVHRLAKQAGIEIADSQITKFGRQHHTFMTKRFDRVIVDGVRKRRHFASAMTMLGYGDGTSYHDGASYLELVEFLMQHGAEVESDLHELWRRIVFSICVSNTDDHLRNHGFLLQADGWKLSPAYDINPSPHGDGLHLNISEVDNSLSLELAMSVAEYFRLAIQEAESIINAVKTSVRTWPDVANQIGIAGSEQKLMSPAFRVVNE